MVKGRVELERYLERDIIKVISDSDKCRKISNYAKDTYELPRILTMDLLTMRVSLSQVSEFVLFVLVESIETVNESKNTNLDKFFTMQEVKTYRTSKYITDKIKFPIRFKVIKVTEDQWLGTIDIAMLMKLRAAQLINYNINAQRTMQKIVRGDKEIYKITINQSAVSSIENLFKKGIYIPTPFTLNIPQDTNSDFYYDEDKREIIIKSLEHFDITDGYHRYVAACQLNDFNPDFNYNMELRIVNWSDDKANQFIYQEDQKTKMRKVDSDSLNMNKAANIVVTRLNESPQCNLQGLIGRNQSIVNFGDLAGLVHYFYFKNITKEKEKSIIISTVKELIENFNMLTEYDSVYLERAYSYRKLITVMFMFDYFRDKNKDKMLEIMKSVIEKVETLDNKKFHSKTPKKSIMNEIETIIKEEI